MKPPDQTSTSSDDESRPRIVDLVFAGETTSPRRRLVIGIVVAIGLYAGAGIVVTRLGQSASAWSAEMAARVHDQISVERAVDVSPPPKPPPPPRLAEVKPSLPTTPHVRSQPTPSPSPSRPTPPAQAGKLAASLAEPVDFTGMAFVVGSGPSYAGGTTTASGTSGTPGTDTAPPGPLIVARENRAPTLSRPVSLDQAAWTCPWPDQADAQQIDEQTVVIRARVRADGQVDNVDVLSDPGFGFAQSARSCALRTHFDPARDSLGQPIVGSSPPIRVHFFR
jgi:protein TonB